MKYTLILIFALLSINTYGQDTGIICMPYGVAKKISHDLIVGDSAKAVLVSTVEELTETQQKVFYQDSVINSEKDKNLNLINQAKNEEDQKNKTTILYTDMKNQYGGLAKKYKRTKTKKTFIQMLEAAIIVTAGYLLLTK